MGFDRFDIRNTNPGVTKRPSGLSHVAAWAGTPPSAYMQVTGWRTSSTPRGYFPTGITTPSEPRCRIEVSLTVFDLTSFSFGEVFVGFTTDEPSNTDGTALGVRFGVGLQGDTDNFAYRAAYPVANDGVLSDGGTNANVNAYNATGTMVLDFYMKPDNSLVMRLDGVEYTTGGGLDLHKTWAYFVVGSASVNAGTSSGSDTGTNYDLRVHGVDMAQMPIDRWNEAGSASPMVMG